MQLAFSCPHLTLEEVVSLDSDRRSLYTRQPIGGLGTVRITVNDDLVIPQGGYFSQAELFGSVSGPFDIIEDETVLAVSTSPLSKGSDITQWDMTKTDFFTFPVRGTVRYSSAEVVKALTGGLAETDPAKCTARPDGGYNAKSQVLVGSENGHLTFMNTTAIGPEACVRVGGSAAGVLGFDVQQVAVGKQLYPAWGIYDRPIERKIDS
jgi:hypothetical protein